MTEFVLTVLSSGAVTLILLGIAGFLGRSQLAHWLNKDLEAVKAQYARQLEAYRNSLIAEAEAVKAAQDVKKLLAMKIAEDRVESLKRVLSLVIGSSNDLGFIYEASVFAFDGPKEIDARNAHVRGFMEGITKRAKELSIAIGLASVHLKSEHLIELRNYSMLAHQILNKVESILDGMPGFEYIPSPASDHDYFRGQTPQDRAKILAVAELKSIHTVKGYMDRYIAMAEDVVDSPKAKMHPLSSAG